MTDYTISHSQLRLHSRHFHHIASNQVIKLKQMAMASIAGVGMKVREMREDDAGPLAESCYHSFLEFNKSVNIAPYLDFPSVEMTTATMKYMSSAPGTFGVVVEEVSSGRIMAAGLITPGEVYGIGPIWADNAFKGRGAAKLVMEALVQKARSNNVKSIRLNQIAANARSFGLYVKMGFAPVECWQEVEGCVTKEQSSFANDTFGFHPIAGAHVRKMEDADVGVCNELYVKSNGVDQEHGIRSGIPSGNAWVLVQHEKIIAYTIGFNLVGHTVAETEEALAFLFTEVCLQHSSSNALPTMHLPGRLYPRLLQWMIAAGLKVTRSCWLMAIGSYQSPQHGMVYCPGVWY